MNSIKKYCNRCKYQTIHYETSSEYEINGTSHIYCSKCAKVGRSKWERGDY